MSLDECFGPDALYRWADQIPVALWNDLCARPAEQAAAAVEARRCDGLSGVFALTNLLVAPMATEL